MHKIPVIVNSEKEAREGTFLAVLFSVAFTFVTLTSTIGGKVFPIFFSLLCYFFTVLFVQQWIQVRRQKSELLDN